MHGRRDKFLSFGHGQWLAARIPGVEARLLDEDGHLTLRQKRIGEVDAWMSTGERGVRQCVCAGFTKLGCAAFAE